ncbi:MAG: type II toxin-antitoxin system Phd/YefM family antitoxin [Chloroflexi bacterium]|nr:type II toxin-antitoxin system Phd/YefM family antitoxin [Chloroflexota bacterium]
MRCISISALREHLSGVVEHVARRRERIVLTRHGRAVGALVPLEDLERLTESVDGNERAGLTPYQTSWRRLTDRIHRRH